MTHTHAKNGPRAFGRIRSLAGFLAILTLVAGPALAGRYDEEIAVLLPVPLTWTACESWPSRGPGYNECDFVCDGGFAGRLLTGRATIWAESQAASATARLTITCGGTEVATCLVTYVSTGPDRQSCEASVALPPLLHEPGTCRVDYWDVDGWFYFNSKCTYTAISLQG